MRRQEIAKGQNKAGEMVRGVIEEYHTPEMTLYTGQIFVGGEMVINHQGFLRDELSMWIAKMVFRYTA
jgi:hypothetical protein